jgi:hypothetical protein
VSLVAWKVGPPLVEHSLVRKVAFTGTRTDASDVEGPRHVVEWHLPAAALHLGSNS